MLAWPFAEPEEVVCVRPYVCVWECLGVPHTLQQRADTIWSDDGGGLSCSELHAAAKELSMDASCASCDMSTASFRKFVLQKCVRFKRKKLQL